jgi:hypothetical protein
MPGRAAMMGGMRNSSCGVGPGPKGMIVIAAGGFASACLYAYAQPHLGAFALAAIAFLFLAAIGVSWWRT